MRTGFALAILMLSGLAVTQVAAAPMAELKLVSEHPVDGMRGGNLSGLALCDNELWTVSDRDDDQIYRLDTRAPACAARARVRPALGLAFAHQGRFVYTRR